MSRIQHVTQLADGTFNFVVAFNPCCHCRELLSPQQHYDWGLRALKTVLRGCGSLLDQEKEQRDGKKGKHVCMYMLSDVIL